jgi:hypothetical protein
LARIASASSFETAYAVHVTLQPPTDRGVAARTEAEALARHALLPVRGVVAQRAAVFLAAVEACELLVAEGHHVVRGEHDAGARAPGRGERLVGEVRVHEVAVHDVRLPVGDDARESAAHPRVVEAHPRAPARVVARQQPERAQAFDLGLAHLRRILHRGDERRLVAELAQARRVLVHLADRRADARVGQVVQEQHLHAQVLHSVA